jgi:hypothetical protein
VGAFTKDKIRKKVSFLAVRLDTIRLEVTMEVGIIFVETGEIKCPNMYWCE